MRRLFSLLPGLTLLTCSGISPAERRAHAPLDARSGPLRLLDHLDAATIDAPGASVLAGELPSAVPGDVVFRDDFESGEGWPRAWFDLGVIEIALKDPIAAAALPRTTLAPEHFEGVGVVRLNTLDDGLIALVPAAAEETWLIRARVKSPGGPTARQPGISYVPLKFELPTFERLVADAQALAPQLLTPSRIVRLPADAGTEWRELRLLARPYRGRRLLAVSLEPGEDGALFDEIELRRLTPIETLALSPDDSVEPASDPRRRRVALDLETWDCLALPTPGRAEFDVVLPESAPRLELACSALTDGAPATLRFRVSADEAGAASFELARSTNGTRSLPFEPATVDLERVAGRRVKLVLEAEGPPGAVALFGAPTLLGAPRAPHAPPPLSVLLISLDTLRADHLGCYGAEEVESPRVDRLAAEGTRFERVLSPASYTLPTHLSMLSGQDPLVHETVRSTDPMDPARTSMLARRMAEAGRLTAAFTGGGLVHPRYGFGVGFDSYSIKDPGGVVGLHRRIGDEADQDARPDEDRVGGIIDWLSRRRDAPFFLFVHSFLVHNYRPSQRELDAAGGGPRPTPDELDRLREAAAAGDRGAIARMHALYRISIAQADREIVGRLCDALEALSLAERTLVVLVADHGEEFFEHAMIGHGDELWHSLTRVPWILRGPGVARGVVRADPVSLADVAPTIAALAGLPGDSRVLGRDQLAFDADQNFAEPKLLSLRGIADRPDQDALVLWPWKLVRRRIGEGPWPAALFRLDDDPDEMRDLASAEPDRAAGLLRLLDRKLEEQDEQRRRLPSTAGAREFEAPPELEWMLDQLGYVKRGER